MVGLARVRSSEVWISEGPLYPALNNAYQSLVILKSQIRSHEHTSSTSVLGNSLRKTSLELRLISWLQISSYARPQPSPFSIAITTPYQMLLKKWSGYGLTASYATVFTPCRTNCTFSSQRHSSGAPRQTSLSSMGAAPAH